MYAMFTSGGHDDEVGSASVVVVPARVVKFRKDLAEGVTWVAFTWERILKSLTNLLEHLAKIDRCKCSGVTRRGEA